MLAQHSCCIIVLFIPNSLSGILSPKRVNVSLITPRKHALGRQFALEASIQCGTQRRKLAHVNRILSLTPSGNVCPKCATEDTIRCGILRRKPGKCLMSCKTQAFSKGDTKSCNLFHSEKAVTNTCLIQYLRAGYRGYLFEVSCFDFLLPCPTDTSQPECRASSQQSARPLLDLQLMNYLMPTRTDRLDIGNTSVQEVSILCGTHRPRPV